MQETYKIDKKDWAAKLMAIVVVVTMVTSTFVLFAPEASARTGSDSYGYSFKDSAESDGPTYDWTDIVKHLPLIEKQGHIHHQSHTLQYCSKQLSLLR